VSKENRVLLIGYSTEKTFRHFVTCALETTPQVDILDLSLARNCRSLSISESSDDLIVELDGDSFQFSRYAAFFSRSYWADLGSQPRNQAIDRLTRAIAAWLVVCPAVVVNRPGAGMSNANKFVHGAILKKVGFLTPSTIVTGAGETLQAYSRTGIDLVSKSCSSAKTRTAALDDALLARAASLNDCPSLFQHRLYGADVRVHWVDELFFAERVESTRVDYRFADPAEPARYIMCDIPCDVARLCRDHCQRENLRLAGFDFKVTAKEEWFLLEVNPMPGFESYDRRQYDRISRAILDLLLRGKPTPVVAPEIFDRPEKVPPSCPPGRTGISAVGDTQRHEREHETAGSAKNANGEHGLFVSEERRPQIRPYYSDPLPLGRPLRS
jgi:hypothetical protein